jgi:glycosyltransferase involved in cell wall biosynthesis
VGQPILAAAAFQAASRLNKIMRVALDATYSLGDGLSGVGVYSRELLHGLANADFGDEWDWFYRWRRFWRARSLPRPPRVTRRLLSDAWGNRAADLFHGLNQRLPKRRFRRQIATFHDLFVLSGDYSTPEFRQRFTRQAREAAAGSDLIVAVSAFTASQVQSYLNVPEARIRVIHHGVVARPIPALAREKVVLCVGAIQRRKNQATLVRAFRAMPEGWSLVLAGSQGYDAARTLSEIAVSPRAGQILVTGYLTDEQLGQWYARAGIFAFPSFDEGFGMPALEAMAAGVPVIAGNRSALPEVCGDAALLIDPQSEEELASALLLLAKDDERRHDLVERGKRRAERFKWEKAVYATAEVYRELLRPLRPR